MEMQTSVYQMTIFFSTVNYLVDIIFENFVIPKTNE